MVEEKEKEKGEGEKPRERGEIREGDYIVLLCTPRAQGYVMAVRDGKYEREVELWEVPDHGRITVGERNVRRMSPPFRGTTEDAGEIRGEP